jgi:phage terminase Nu1 subunit (DNA packaging protein)
MQAQKAELKEAKTKVKRIKTSLTPYVNKELTRITATANPTPIPDNVLPFKSKDIQETSAAESRPYRDKGIDEPYFAFVAPWLAGELSEAIRQWKHHSLGNISARAATQWKAIAWLLPESLGLTREDEEKYFADIARLAREHQASLEANKMLPNVN